MATEVDICNLALSRVKGGEIGSLTEQSVQAIQCKILYSMVRDHLLTVYSWGFNKATRALSLKSDTPQEWLYAYDYPNDCLKVHYILPPNATHSMVSSVGVPSPSVDYPPIPYEVAAGDNGSKLILTDAEDAYISYNMLVTDTRLFDQLFVQAMAWNLAMELATPLGGDSGERYYQRAQRGFMEAMGQAAAHSANEAENGMQRLPKSIQARHGAIDKDYFYNGLAYRRY